MNTAFLIRAITDLLCGLALLGLCRARVSPYILWTCFIVFLGVEVVSDFKIYHVIKAIGFITVLGFEYWFPRNEIPSRDRDDVYCYFFVKNFSVLVYVALFQGYFLKNLPFQPAPFRAPFWIQCIVCCFVLDFLMYMVHRGEHYFNFWWKFHRVHHMSTHLRSIAAARTHLGEFLLVQVTILILASYFMGVKPEAVMLGFVIPHFFIAEILAHSNLNIGKDSILARVVALPNTHAVHHFSDGEFKNYGQIFIFWDVLFGTYVKPTHNKANRPIGLPDFVSSGRFVDEQLLKSPLTKDF